MQSPLLHAARADPQTEVIEEENLHPVSSLVGEKKNMPALRILLELANDQSIETVKA